MKCPLKPVKGLLVCVFPEGAIPKWESQEDPINKGKTIYIREGDSIPVAEDLLEKGKAQDRSDYIKDGKPLTVIAENSENYDFNVGDSVLMKNFAGADPIYFEGEEYIFVRDMNILCTIEK